MLTAFQTIVERVVVPQSPAPPALPGQPGQVVNPAATYRAYRAQREELRNQLSNVEEKRTLIARRLRGEDGVEAAAGPDKIGLEARIADLDAQIAVLYKQIREADANVANAAAIPGATSSPARNGPPDGAFAVGAIFTIFVLGPIAIALARNIWRRGAAKAAAIPKDLMERLTRIEDSVESVAIELERVGEGQRFVTNMFIESAAPQLLGTGAMQMVEAKRLERVEAERRGL